MSEQPASEWREVRRPEEVFEVSPPAPVRAMLLNGWPMAAAVIVLLGAFAVFFPALGAFLIFFTPLAIGAAFLVGAVRVRGIRLRVTDEVVQVTNGKAGAGCDRTQIRTAVLVDSFSRRRTLPRRTDLILLDPHGRALLLLAGLLWPREVLEDVIDLLIPVDVVRVPGRHTPKTLARRFPRLLEPVPGQPAGRSPGGIILLAALIVVLLAVVFVALAVFLR